MTASSCRDHGGDWSTYASYLIKDFPDLLAFRSSLVGAGKQGHHFILRDARFTSCRPQQFAQRISTGVKKLDRGSDVGEGSDDMLP